MGSLIWTLESQLRMKLLVLMFGFIFLATGAEIGEFDIENDERMKDVERNVHDTILDINEREVQNQQENVNIDEEINRINEEKDVPNLEEGDMVIEGKSAVVDDGKISKRGALTSTRSRWTNNVVPYQFDSRFPSSYRTMFEKVIADFHKKTCIRFRKRTSSDRAYINIKKSSGCWSYVGMTGKKQDLSIGSGCNHFGIIQHELMHALGFKHEQSRTDRDKYVSIKWNNIQKGREGNFNKASALIEHKIYDFDSVMHYGKTAFAIDRSKPTIVAIGNPNQKFGQRDGASTLDIVEINAIYNCKSTGGLVTTPWSQWGPCDRSTCKVKRERTCSKPDDPVCKPNTDKNGIQIETKDCAPNECNAKIDGNWGQWSTSSSCSVTCGKGVQTRTRKCNQPAPANGGKACPGSSTDQQPCEMGACNLGSNGLDFEGGFRAWTNLKNDQADWVIRSGRTPSCATGPDSGADGSKKYAYFESSCPRKQGHKAILQSPVITATSATQLSLAYSMYGSTMGSFEIYVKHGSGSFAKIFNKSGNQGKGWKQASLDLGVQKGQTFQVQLVAIRGSSYRSDIAIDNILFQASGQPVTTRRPDVVTTRSPGTDLSASDDTNFENGKFGTWTNEKGDNADWIIRSGKTPSSGTGPNGGKSSRYYAYFESSYPRKVGDKAVLLSKPITAQSDKIAFTFSYHMYGSSMGTLKVHLKRAGALTEIFTKSGDQGNQWKDESLDLDVTAGETFQVQITAIRGSSYRSDIAIDNLSFVSSGSGNVGNGNGGNGNGGKVLDFVNFENRQFGKWTPQSSWLIRSGKTPSGNTGPNTGANGSKVYAYFESSYPRRTGEIAALFSPIYAANGKVCLEFSYSMYGRTMGKLEVNLVGEATPIFTKSGDQGNAWKKASLNFNANGTFQLKFTATRGTSYTSDIALDDITVKTC